MNERYASGLGFFFSLVFASVVFCYLYGLYYLDPSHIQWMLQGDPSVHFFGFNFFLYEPWHWPLGKITDFNWPAGTSLVFSDSIPLVSLPLKLFFRGTSFQFHGLWILFCFLLQGGLGYLLALRLKLDPFSSSMVSILLTLFPPFLFRNFEVTRHYSCLAHFLVLGALYLASMPELSPRPIRKYWVLLLGASLGIHFYFFYLNALIFVFAERKQLLTKAGLRFLVISGICSVFVMYLFGYFVIPVGHSFEGGFGYYSMNLLSWFDSRGFSLLHLKLPSISDEQREGFQYLGLGIFLLLALLLTDPKKRTLAKQQANTALRNPLALLLAFVFFLALSSQLSIGSIALPDYVSVAIYLSCFYVLFLKLSVPRLQALLYTVLLILFYFLSGHLLRSSGRTGWYLSYLLILWLITLKPSRPILLLVTLLQIADVAPILMSIRSENDGLLKKSANTLAQYEKIEREGVIQFLNQNSTLSFFDVPQSGKIPVTYFALKHHLKLGPVYLARGNSTEMSRARDKVYEKLQSGKLSPEEVIVTCADLSPNQISAPFVQMKGGGYLWIK